MRMKIWERDIGKKLEGKCYVCERILYIDGFEAGHILAEFKGGLTQIDNLKVICKPCNGSMGIMNLEEFKKNLTSKDKENIIINENLLEDDNKLMNLFDEDLWKKIKNSHSYVNQL